MTLRSIANVQMYFLNFTFKLTVQYKHALSAAETVSGGKNVAFLCIFDDKTCYTAV